MGPKGVSKWLHFRSMLFSVPSDQGRSEHDTQFWADRPFTYNHLHASHTLYFQGL